MTSWHASTWTGLTLQDGLRAPFKGVWGDIHIYIYMASLELI